MNTEKAKELLQEILDSIELGKCGEYSTSGDWYREAKQLLKDEED